MFSRLRSTLLFSLLLAGLVTSAFAEDATLDPISPRLATADAERGATVFLQCRACHVAEPGAQPTVGPNLWGVVGRPVGAAAGFTYSDSLKAIGGEWDFETLSRYLFDPRTMAPQGRMIFAGVKSARDRADLIAYLNSLSETPLALPSAPLDLQGPIFGGLPEGEGRDAVYFTCRACHALEQFTDRRLSREDWDSLLNEMVSNHGMASPEPWAQTLMLNYLEAKFGPERNWQGLPSGPGREEVFHSCNACHSLRIVTQQGMSRSRWDATLDWMVEEQGMTEISDQATRDRILDYLSTHFGSG